jgi:hypothetical protein
MSTFILFLIFVRPDPDDLAASNTFKTHQSYSTVVCRGNNNTMDFSQGPALGAAIAHRAPVTSLSYHSDGVHLFAATEADSKLYMINTQTGKAEHPGFKIEREGISLVSST